MSRGTPGRCLHSKEALPRNGQFQLAELLGGSHDSPPGSRLLIWWGAVLLLLLGVLGNRPRTSLGCEKKERCSSSPPPRTSCAGCGFFSPEALGLRSRWGWIAGRFLLPAVAALAVLGAADGALIVTVGSPGGCRAWLVLRLGHGDSRSTMGSSIARLGGALLIAAAIFVAVVTAVRKTQRLPRNCGREHRGRYSYRWRSGLGSPRVALPVWRAAAERRSYDLHPFLREYGSAVALWERVDRQHAPAESR